MGVPSQGKDYGMKKLILVSAIMALTAAGASAGGFGLFGSYWDIDDSEDAGTGGGLKLQADMSGDGVLGFEFRLSGITGYGGEGVFKDAWTAPIEADLTLGLPLGDGGSKIYVGAGGGYYVMPEFESKIAMGDSLQPDIDPDDSFGWFAVAGIELMFSDTVGLFGEAVYRSFTVDKMKVDGVEVDIGDDNEWKGIGANAGLIFKF